MSRPRMGRAVDQEELRRRALDGVRAEVEAFGGGAGDSRIIRRDGLVASLMPAAPERSLFNSVLYESPAALSAEIDPLQAEYEKNGIRAWTVWVPDEDRDSAALLERRGHLLDAAPRAMALNLADLRQGPPRPQGVEPRRCEPAVAAALNDRAYGYEAGAFRAALGGETSIRWHGAHLDGEAVCCVGLIEIGDDCCVTGVATPPEHRGRGTAAWLLRHALAEARDAGSATGSLQATKAGAPLYERLGFSDLGFIEMWELRH